jgi:hypothetical protein
MTVFVGLVVGMAVWAYVGWFEAVGLLAGAVLGSANLWLLWRLAHLILTPRRGPVGAILVAFFLKVVGVYGLGAVLLLWVHVPALWFLVGFSLVLLVVVLKALGRWMTATAQPARHAAGAGIRGSGDVPAESRELAGPRDAAGAARGEQG